MVLSGLLAKEVKLRFYGIRSTPMSCSKKSLAALLGSINAPYTLFRRPDPEKSNRHHVMIIVILLTVNKTTILLLTILIIMIILVINYLSWAPKDRAGQSLEVISDSIREGVEPAG